MSERDIAKHVSTGELHQTGSEFVCNICSSPLGQQPLPHIQGTAHKNAVFLHALSQPSKYKALYYALPQVVQDAHSKGVVTVKDSKFKCGPCGMEFTGEKPLTDHLSSSKHRNKAASQVPPMVLIPPTAGVSSAQPTFPTFSNVDNSALFGQPPAGQPSLIHPVVANAIKNGHVKATGSTDFECTLCRDTKVITGVEPMRQHLEGRVHKKSLQERQLRDDGQQAGAGAPHQPHSTYPIVSPDQQRDLNQQSFNMGSLNQSITINVQLPSPHFPAGEAPTGANYQYGSDAGPVLLNPTGKVAEARFAQPCTTYKNRSSPRGIVVIFNYIFTKKIGMKRNGARRDHENLHAVFTEMKYDVWPINIDRTRQETMDKLDEVRNSPKLKEVDSLITVFLSHGGQSEDEFLAFDEQPISVNEILYSKFTDQECPHMKGKPKLFIFNYCRGQVTPSNPVQYDSWNPPSTHQHEAPSDVALIQATLPHFAAGRYTDTGTIFVSEFCKVLKQNSGSMELVEIIHETSKQMKKDAKGNTPTVTPIHFGKFKFM